MAAPYWISVALISLMTVRNGATAIETHKLEPIIQDILNRYTPSYKNANGDSMFPMFSVAVSIPYNTEECTYEMKKVPDSGEAVTEKIIKCDIYQGVRVVAATVLRWRNVLYQCPKERVQWADVPKKCNGKQIKTWADVDDFCDDNEKEKLYAYAEHAEPRTLNHFKNLEKIKKDDDLMVFYVRSSPCDETCTNEENSQRNILKKIEVLKKWKNYVVVFSNIFNPPDRGDRAREEDLRRSLERLGKAISKDKNKSSNGLENIFRCYEDNNENEMKCFSCNTSDKVAHKCVLDV